MLTACLVTGGAMAQTVYKCGNTYSQLPCPNAAVINADARIASVMVKARLQQKKADALVVRTPSRNKAAPDKAASPSS